MLPGNIKKFNFLKIADYHKKGYKGQGVKIAIIDTPFQIPDSWGNVHYAREEMHNTLNWEHGAMTTNVLRQIVPEAEIYLFDMYKYFPWEVINWCVDNNIDIISASIGYINPPDWYLSGLAKASNKFMDSGGLMFASAGNSDYKGVFAPAKKSSWVAVGAADLKNGIPTRLHYSAVGSEVEVMSFTNLEVDVSDVGPTDWDIYTGTSAACPCLAGTAALFIQAREAPCTRAELKRVIKNNTIEVVQPFRSEYMGYGLFILPDDPDVEYEYVEEVEEEEEEKEHWWCRIKRITVDEVIKFFIIIPILTLIMKLIRIIFKV